MCGEARTETLSACDPAPWLDRPADRPPDRGLGRLAEQTRQRYTEGLSSGYNGPERRVQGRIFEFLEVLEIDPDGIGRLLLRPPAGSPQARQVRGKILPSVLEGRPRSHVLPVVPKGSTKNLTDGVICACATGADRPHVRAPVERAPRLGFFNWRDDMKWMLAVLLAAVASCGGSSETPEQRLVGKWLYWGTSAGAGLCLRI